MFARVSGSRSLCNGWSTLNTRLPSSHSTRWGPRNTTGCPRPTGTGARRTRGRRCRGQSRTGPSRSPVGSRCPGSARLRSRGRTPTGVRRCRRQPTTTDCISQHMIYRECSGGSPNLGRTRESSTFGGAGGEFALRERHSWNRRRERTSAGRWAWSGTASSTKGQSVPGGHLATADCGETTHASTGLGNQQAPTACQQAGASVGPRMNTPKHPSPHDGHERVPPGGQATVGASATSAVE